MDSLSTLLTDECLGDAVLLVQRVFRLIDPDNNYDDWTRVTAEGYPSQSPSSSQCGIFMLMGMKKASRAPSSTERCGPDGDWGFALCDMPALRFRCALDILRSQPAELPCYCTHKSATPCTLVRVLVTRSFSDGSRRLLIIRLLQKASWFGDGSPIICKKPPLVQKAPLQKTAHVCKEPELSCAKSPNSLRVGGMKKQGRVLALAAGQRGRCVTLTSRRRESRLSLPPYLLAASNFKAEAY